MLYKKIIRDIKLLFQSPKDFLYSYTYSSSKKSSVLPFNPIVKVKAGKIIKSIEARCPDIHVILIGSTGLEICGQGDIDLIASAPHQNFPTYIQALNSLFGKPKVRPNFLEWKKRLLGVDVDLNFYDPKLPEMANQLKLFNFLKQNPQFLNEYVDLKNNSNGLSKRESVRSRMVFFNRIIRHIK